MNLNCLHKRIIKWFVVVSLCLPVFLAAQGNTGETELTLFFDFGTDNSVLMPGAIRVTDKTVYKEKNGYGLLREADETFILSDNELKNEMTIDGILSADRIQFRVDIPAGNYWVEMFLEGGELSLWQGRIFANEQLIADSIYQYGVSFEGEEPPVYWSILKPVTNVKDVLDLSIDALNQQSTVTGIAIYRDNPGPLSLVDGRCVADSDFSVPNAELILKLLNRGEIAEAQRYIDQLPENDFRYEKALLLMALSGRLEIQDPRTRMDLAVELLKEEYEVNNKSDVALNLRLATLYSEGDMYYKMAGWDWARVYTGAGIFDRLNIAGHNFKKIFEITNHPVNHRAAFYLGRLSFWAWVEQHNRWQKIRADQCFEYLNQYYPDYRLLQIYSGQQLFAENEISYTVQTDIPAWVNQTSLALKNLRDVIHYWVDFRQADNGEFGGKYDDDVEMLRWWPIARLALSDPKTLLGMRRLVDGVWSSGWITNGFSTKVRDVEHSSEPVADTQPMMIGLDYGNPLYVERCMESIKGLRDVWTGINKKGHLHFKSSWYSYKENDTRPPRDCDVEMNSRTVKAARWLAWYNRHPFAMQFMIDWSDAWLEDCQRTDKGKPYGIVPAAIRYRDDAIGGHADNWHHPGMFWGYYDFHGGTLMLRQFLTMYQLTDNEKYLEPIEEALKLVEKYYSNDVSDAEIGSEAWVAAILKGSSSFTETIELWRLMTGNNRFDHILAEIGSDYLKFRLTGNKQFLLSGSKQVTDGILYNRELITTEGYFTDRIEIGDINKSEVWGANHLESMYSGSALHEGFHPYYNISWNGFVDDFVAAVVHADRQRVQVIAFNLNDESIDGSISFWTLEPGEYEMQTGPDKDDDGIMETVDTRRKFMVTGRNTEQMLTLPPQAQQLIHVRQIKSSVDQPFVGLADLAVVESDVTSVQDRKKRTLRVTVPVHNIGIAEAEKIDVRMYEWNETAKILIGEQTIPHIAAPLDLEPRISNVEFDIDMRKIQYTHVRIVLDADVQIPEITEVNNQISFSYEELLTGADGQE